MNLIQQALRFLKDRQSPKRIGFFANNIAQKVLNSPIVQRGRVSTFGSNIKEPVGVPLGRLLQRFPDTTIRAPQTTRPVGFGLPYGGVNATEFLSSIPGEMVRGYGKTLERMSTPQGRSDIRTGVRQLATQRPSLNTLNNPAVQSALDVSDFLPIGLVTRPGRKLVTEGLEKVARQGGEKVFREGLEKSFKEAVEKDARKAVTNYPSSGLSESFVEKLFPNNPKAKEILQEVNPKGLMNESTAQTAFRRESGLTPNQAYTKELVDKVKQDVSTAFKSGDFKTIERVQNNLDPDFTKVTKKVNWTDYLRTPEVVLKKIGLEDEAKFLRQQHEKYLTQLPEEIGKIQAWMKRVPNKQSSAKIFNYLDGKTVDMTPEEIKVADEIREYFSQWADKLNLPKEKRVTNYVTHLFEKNVSQAEFNDEIAKLIDKQVAGSVYNPFLEARKKNDLPYIQDVFRSLDAYVKRATRAYNMDPALRRIKDASKDLELSQADFIEKYTARINMRPEKMDTLIDNWIKTTPVGYRLGPRPTTAITQAIRQQVYRGALGLNVSSAIRNLSQAANTYAKLGEKYTILGYLKLAKNWGSDELTRVGVLRDSFIEDQTLSVYKRVAKTVDKGLFALFETAEKINRGAAYYGAKAKALNKGMDEEAAIESAKELVRKTQFTFSSIDTPLGMSSDIVKTLTQFQSFGVKQVEFLTDMAKNKEYLGLLRYIGSTLAMAHVLQDQFGIKLEALPQFGLSPTVQAGKGLLGMAFGEGQTREDAKKQLKNSAWLLAPGGVQLKKTLEGLRDYSQGYSQTPKGNLRYEVPQGPENLIKSLLFSSRATPQGQEYYQNYAVSKAEQFYKTLKNNTPEENARRMRALKEADPASYRAVVDFLEEKRLKISGREKQIKGLNVRDGSRARAVIAELKKQNSPAGKADLYKRYLQLGILSEETAKMVQALVQQGALK